MFPDDIRLFGTTLPRATVRILALIFGTSLVSGIAWVYQARSRDFQSGTGLAYDDWIWVSMLVLLFATTWRASVPRLAGLSLWITAAGLAMQSLARTYPIYQVGSSIASAGELGLTSAVIVAACRQLPVERLMLAPFLGGLGWTVGNFTPELGIYRLLPQSEFGLAFAAALAVALVPTGFRLESDSLKQDRQEPNASVLSRLIPLVFAPNALTGLLWVIASYGRPYPPNEDLDYRTGLMMAALLTLPPLLVLSLFLWRKPRRFALAIRLMMGLLLISCAVAWAMPTLRLSGHYFAAGMNGLATVLATYTGVRAVPQRFALPMAAGIGTVAAIGWALSAEAAGLALPGLVMALVSTAVFLIALLVFPMASPAVAPESTPQVLDGGEGPDLGTNLAN